MSRKPDSRPPLCFFGLPFPCRQVKKSSGVIPMPESERVGADEAELKLEQPELGCSAGLRFTEPEGAPASAGPPGRPSVPPTIRRSLTMNMWWPAMSDSRIGLVELRDALRCAMHRASGES